MIELTLEEAENLCRQSLCHDGSDGDEIFHNFPTSLQLQMMAGVTALIWAMQEMGYRVNRPLAAVPEKVDIGGGTVRGE
jgi:hypothetical protein